MERKEDRNVEYTCGCCKVNDQKIGDYKTDSRGIVLFLRYYVKNCIVWVFVIIVSVYLLYEYWPAGMKTTKKWYVLPVFIMVPIIMALFQCRNHYPKIFYNRRKRHMVSHDLSLEGVLQSIGKWVQSDTRLTSIDKKSRKTLSHLRPILKKYCQGMTDFKFFLVGSTAEKLNIQFSPGNSFGEVHDDSHALISDLDYMVSPGNETVSFTPDRGIELCKNDEKLLPGYVYLRKKDGNERIKASRVRKNLLKAVREMRTRHIDGYMRPKVYCGCFIVDKENHASARLQGPAVKLKFSSAPFQVDRFFVDLTFAFKCPKWPDEVSDWTYRPGKKWPNNEHVKRIASMGCHVVPKSQPGDGYTWRLSFSTAEFELCRLAPQTAREGFLGLKVITKDYLSVTYKGLSYALKCLFLRTLETEPEFWRRIDEESPQECFLYLLQKLADAIANRNCPHFWIPHINLFEDLTKNNAKKLSKKMKKIKKQPQQYIETPYKGDGPSDSVNNSREQPNQILNETIV